MKKILALLIASTTFLNAQTINSSLTACYPFQGNSQNYASSGSALNGITSNISYTTGHSGIGSTAVHFAGDTSSHVQLPSNTLIKSKKISISGWFYADNIQDSYVIYTPNNCSSNDEAYSLVYKTNAFLAEIASGTTCAR